MSGEQIRRRWKLILLAASATVACAVLPVDAAKVQTLTFMTLYDQKTVGWDAAVKEFEAKNPGAKIKVVRVNWSEIVEKYLAGIVAGTAPDVLTVANEWLYMFTNRNLLAQVPAGIEADLRKQFYPTAIEMATQKGRMWGVPAEWQGLGLAINKTLFQEKGLIPEIPKDWDTMAAAAKKLAVWNGNVLTRYGFETTAPYNSGSTTWAIYWALRGAAGGQNVPDGFTSLPASEPSEAALKYLYDLIYLHRADSITPKYAGDFYSGKQPMRFAQSDQMGEYVIKNKTVRNACDFGPIPARNGGAGYSTEWGWMVSVSKSSKNPSLAWKFATLLGSPKYSESLANGINTWPTRPDAQPASDHIRAKFSLLARSKATWFGNHRRWSNIHEEGGNIVLKVLKGQLSTADGLRQIDEAAKRNSLGK